MITHLLTKDANIFSGNLANESSRKMSSNLAGTIR